MQVFQAVPAEKWEATRINNLAPSQRKLSDHLQLSVTIMQFSEGSTLFYFYFLKKIPAPKSSPSRNAGENLHDLRHLVVCHCVSGTAVPVNHLLKS